MRIVLDVENTTTKRNGKTHMDPFEANNFLVQVGTKNVDIPSERYLLTFDHVEENDRTGANAKLLQTILDKTTLLIMHNAQHDLMWLWSSGFKYEGEIYDTMLAEYLLQRGQKQPLSLLACAERRNLTFQKDDTLIDFDFSKRKIINIKVSKNDKENHKEYIKKLAKNSNKKIIW